MDKKDAVFIATTLMIKDRFKNFDPEEGPIEDNKKFTKAFSILYGYLAQVYEEDCQSPFQKKA